MAITLDVISGYPEEIVRIAIRTSLQNELMLAQYRYEQFAEECQAFEQKYHFDSETFMRKFEGGDLGDDPDFFDWFAAKRGLDIWKRQCEILKGIQL